MTLFLPPTITRGLQQERLQMQTDLVKMTHMKETMDSWNRDLRQIDPYLELIKAQENPEVQIHALKPGYWHIIRHNPDAPPSITTWEGPEGEYREPDSGIYDHLRLNDLQNPEVMKAIKKKRITLERLRKERENRENEERRQELFERLAANRDVRISFDRDAKWTQNVSGRRAYS